MEGFNVDTAIHHPGREDINCAPFGACHFVFVNSCIFGVNLIFSRFEAAVKYFTAAQGLSSATVCLFVCVFVFSAAGARALPKVKKARL